MHRFPLASLLGACAEAASPAEHPPGRSQLKRGTVWRQVPAGEQGERGHGEKACPPDVTHRIARKCGNLASGTWALTTTTRSTLLEPFIACAVGSWPDAVALGDLNQEATVDVDVSRDGGQSWSLLAQGIANAQRFDWTVEGPASRACVFRVQWSAHPAEVFGDSPSPVSRVPGLRACRRTQFGSDLGYQKRPRIPDQLAWGTASRHWGGRAQAGGAQ